MPRVDIVRESAVNRTARVMQVEGIFDVPPSQRSAEQWSVNLALPEQWNIGVIVGPSGSGKTTVAREIFGDHLVTGWQWPEDKSILDGFPASLGIKEITALLSSVGFSSPPSWLRPFHVLSNGEQFRVTMARTLAEMPSIAVVDEFTSVVDRTVAQIGSAAIAKTVRRRKQQLIAVTCHYDVLEWLEPDWVYEPATDALSVGRLLQRPCIELEIARVHSSAWEMFRKHHYLDHALNSTAVCFCAFWRGVPIAFTAVLHFPHATAKNIKREHRTVCLPDFQGVGVGNRMSAYIGSVCRGLGYRWMSQTSHPAMIRARAASAVWKMTAKPNNKSQTMPAGSFAPALEGSSERSFKGKTSGLPTRLRATFEYAGPALPADEARRVWDGK
jgi:hypothetical protein